MENAKQMVVKLVEKMAGVDAEYVLQNSTVQDKMTVIEHFEKEGKTHLVESVLRSLETHIIPDILERNLFPTSVKVGDGVTMCLYSDAHAGTVVKVTKTQVIVKRDIATLDSTWKPEFISGGFAGHCTNQNEQRYTYEQDPNAEEIRFTWSKKKGRYINNSRSLRLIKGRREFYDYNF